MVVEITIMKTNKIGHFICGVLATYGLVVACGNMKDSKLENNTTEIEMKDDFNDEITNKKLKSKGSELKSKIGKKGKKEKSNKNCPCL